MDGEGGKRFEMLEEDLTQLREEAVEALTQTMQQVNEIIANLESRMEKMEIQAARTTLQKNEGVKVLLNEDPSNPEQHM